MIFFFFGQTNSDVAQRGTVGRRKLTSLRSPLGVLKFYSPADTHQRPEFFWELGWWPGSRDVSGTWSVLRSLWSHWGGGDGNALALSD